MNLFQSQQSCSWCNWSQSSRSTFFFFFLFLIWLSSSQQVNAAQRPVLAQSAWLSLKGLFQSRGSKQSDIPVTIKSWLSCGCSVWAPPSCCCCCCSTGLVLAAQAWTLCHPVDLNGMMGGTVIGRVFWQPAFCFEKTFTNVGVGDQVDDVHRPCHRAQNVSTGRSSTWVFLKQTPMFLLYVWLIITHSVLPDFEKWCLWIFMRFFTTSTKIL